jgi:predicted PurR-regulated permease PerM
VWGPFRRRAEHGEEVDRGDRLDAAEPTEQRAPARPTVVPRWIQAVLLPLALLLLYEIGRAAGTLLLVVIVAAIVALILNPLARQLERTMPRWISILGVYGILFAILFGIGALLVSLLSTQVSHFSSNVPQLIREANHEIVSIQRFLDRHGIAVHIERQGQSALQTLEKDVLKSSGSIVSFSRGLLSDIVTTSIDIVLAFVLSIYLLVYAPTIGAAVRRLMPPGDGTAQDDFPLLVQRAVSGYVRGQLAFSVIMGGSAALLLWLFGTLGIFPAGANYAIFFGAFYGLAELVPYIGPFIGAVPPVLVALFTDPISALWVVLLFIGLQQLEGHLVAPQVFRISLRINPIIVILALLLGYQLWGIPGSLVALPIATILRQSILYLRRHVVLEPWGTMQAGEIGLRLDGPPGHGAEPDLLPRSECAECGLAAGIGDTFCRRCGAAIPPPGPGGTQPGAEVGDQPRTTV